MRYSVFSHGALCAVFLSMCGLIGVPLWTAEAKPDAAQERQSEEIVSLARAAKNVEAIALYESLPEGATVSMVDMRAVACCYWRERQFDKPRELYQRSWIGAQRCIS